MSIHVPSTRALPLVAVMLAGCLAASACGGSSGKSSTTTATNATAAAGATGTTPSAGGGSTGSAHSGSPSSGSPSGGSSSSGSGSPSGVGGSSNNSSSNPSSQNNTTKSVAHGKYSAKLVAAVKAFATCVRGHGVPLKEPNFSGHGEVFSDQGVNTHSPQFEAAMQACEGYLFAVLRAGGAKLPGASG